MLASPAENPFLPLSFIAGPALLTNASAVLLNGASIRYNLAVGLWRDLQGAVHGGRETAAPPYRDPAAALQLAHDRVLRIVRALNLLYGAVGGFAFSTLTGLVGALGWTTEARALVEVAKWATLLAGVVGLSCVLAAAATFLGESRITARLLRLGLGFAPPPGPFETQAAEQAGP